MSRHIFVLGCLLLACAVIDAGNADAQGLFRRLQERVRSRLEAPPEPAGESGDAEQPAVRQPSPAPPSPAPPSPAPPSPAPPSPAPPSPAPPSPAPPGDDASRYGRSVLSRGDRVGETLPDPQARPSLGVSVVESGEAVPGLQIAAIRSESLADEAGLRVDDLIIAIDGKPTPTIAAVVELMSSRRVGDRVRVTVIRDQTTETLTLGLVESAVARAKPAVAPTPVAPPAAAEETTAAPPTSEFGVTLQRPSGSRGLTIVDVAADSTAAAAGLIAGDRIVSVDGRLLRSAEAFARAMANRKPSDTIDLQLERDGKLLTVEVGATTGALSQAAADKSDRPASVMQGLGSVLGGLLGGDASGKPNRASQQPKQAEPKQAKPRDEAAQESRRDQAGGPSPVTQAGFESLAPAPTDRLKNDPPSLRGLKPPPRLSAPLRLNPPAPTKAETIAALREQIRQLEARLKALEAEE